MKDKTCLLLIFIIVVCLPTMATAARQYVTDQLVITIRETADPGSSPIGHLNTDDPVEVLAEEGEFAKMNAGPITGYVRTQYLTSTPPKQFTIDKLEQEVARLKKQLESYASGTEDQKQELVQLRQTNGQLETELQEAKTKLAELQEKYQDILSSSKDLMTIIQERDQLRETNVQLAAETSSLREENESLLATGIIKWFLAGAGTLLFGWLLGKFSRKKRRAF